MLSQDVSLTHVPSQSSLRFRYPAIPMVLLPYLELVEALAPRRNLSHVKTLCGTGRKGTLRTTSLDDDVLKRPADC